MAPEGKQEMIFVPSRPGEYACRCRGLEGKGMTGKFIVK
jgi:heme/copper-type cytochrome/quinol oxidase subunit 2